MNILIVSQYFWPEDFRVNEIAVSLVKRGHAVTVLTGEPNYPHGKFFTGYGGFGNRRQMYEGVEIIRVPIVPRGSGGGLSLLLNYFSFVLSASIAGPLRCRGQYDVIFVHEPSPITVGIPAIVLKWLKNAPVVFWVLDLWPETLAAVGVVKSQKLLNIVGWLVKFIYSQCGRILIQSELFRSSIERYGVDPGTIEYFPNYAEGAFTPVVRSDHLSSKYELPDGFLIMFAGNVGVAQDFETILVAAEYLKDKGDIHWVILGEGRMYSWVKDEIERRSLKSVVHLLGRHPIEEMPNYFSLADVMLVTLKREPVFALTIPAKVQAYMACAKPIVAGLEGAGAQIINDSGCGFVAEPEDFMSLANAVLRIYKMEIEDRVLLGQAGKEYYNKHFSRDVLIDRLESWLNDVAI